MLEKERRSSEPEATPGISKIQSLSADDEKKGSGRKRAAVLALLLLLLLGGFWLIRGGRTVSVPGVDRGEALSLPNQTSSNGPATSAPAVQPALDRTNSIPETGSKPEVAEATLDNEAQKEAARPNTGPVSSGSPILANSSDGHDEPGVVVERPAPEGVEPRPSERMAPRTEKEKKAEFAGLLRYAEKAYQRALTHLDPSQGSEVEQALNQARQLYPGDTRLKALDQKLAGLAAEIDGRQGKTPERSPLQARDALAGSGKETATPRGGEASELNPANAVKGPAAGEKTFIEPFAGINFVLVKGGCFQMGSNKGDPDAKPVHEVCVDDFYMGEYQVTQAQYEKITGRNPSFLKGRNRPVESVSWEEAQDCIRTLNQASGMNYDLPSEAEWEYAARNGGKVETWAETGNGSPSKDYEWYANNRCDQSYSSNQNGPNELGLYDMTVNGWEWVSDWYGPKYYASSPRNNPQGPQKGSYRVIRAGSCSSGPQFADRYAVAPDDRYDYLGFRIVFPARKKGDGFNSVAMGD